MATEAFMTIDQGSKKQFIVDVSGIDLTGYSARGMVRADRISDVVLADWASYLTVNSVDRQVALVIPADVTSTYTWDNGRYDIEVYVVGNEAGAIRIIQGDVHVDKGVTR
jgi:hypothetical protein